MVAYYVRIIEIRFNGGSYITEAIKTAIALAQEENVEVHFKFNDTLVVVSEYSDPKHIEYQWTEDYQGAQDARG